jgi:DNA-binding CsgD family transcriptional regulator
MLYGRYEERARIAALLAGARGGHAGVLVVRGEAGIGKHALLQDAAEQASGFLVLCASGFESEAEVAFAGLQQLLGPVLDRLDRLPAPQAGALRGAFGLADTQANRFLVELGVLSLLAAVAVERPVLCLLAHARWLDAASADVLVFVARRLQGEPVAMLFAARDDDLRRFQAPGLPELHLGGLDPDDAGALLDAQVGGLAPAVRERVIEDAAGNPLALLELPASLSGEQLAGLTPLPARLPLTTRLEQVFLERFRGLPEATQTLLLVAAAEATGELATVLLAGQALGSSPAALEPAERAGLVQVLGQELWWFRHPLVRSAIYQAATFTARQAAHRALIQVLRGQQQADRRAWHLAAATLGPDEEVAAALEASAERAQRRGGPAAAAAALERAATLTPEPGGGARRLVAAAACLWEAGQGGRAQTLLDQAEPTVADPAVRVRMAWVRGEIELTAGTPATACTLLVEAATLLGESDPEQATELLVLAAWAALAANQLHRVTQEIGPAVPHLAGHQASRIRRVADSLAAIGLDGAAPADRTQQRTRGGGEATSTWPPPSATWGWPMLVTAEPATDDVAAHQQYVQSVALARASGTVATLTVALANLAIAEFSMGRWPDATGTAAEAFQLATDTGQHAMASYFLLLLGAIALLQGHSQDFRRLADQALAIATPRRLAVVIAAAAWNLARLDQAEGRPAAALERLLSLTTPEHPNAHAGIAMLATRELVEAAVHADRVDGLEPHVAKLERWARWEPGTFTWLVARRCRALITPGPLAERHYEAALATSGIHELPYEQALTELLYGEWLRRARRRVDARAHLRAALELFQRLGAALLVERATAELRASGETARQRNPSTVQQLTPQERQVARLASQGLTNHQIADRLFLSTHTISYHLHKIYTKLAITSRVELSRLDLDDDAAR